MIERKNRLRKRSIFFAFPWSKLTKRAYEKIIDTFKDAWNIYYGSEIKTNPAEQGKYEKFRTQNKHLFDRFVTNILRSDIFIADITERNANVMIELGIAINQNKNILILSGKAAEKLPFDVSGVEVVFYKDEKDLIVKITEYLQTFINIKEMVFGQKVPESYFSHNFGFVSAAEDSFKNGRTGSDVYRIAPLPIKLPRMKDLKLRVKYRILDSYDNSDWFGFILRSSVENRGAYEALRRGSILVNARVNGNTDITLYPGEFVVTSQKTHAPHDRTAFRLFEIELDNEYIKVSGCAEGFELDTISLVEFGYLYLACFRSKVEYKDLEILNTDTTSEIYPPK